MGTNVIQWSNFDDQVRYQPIAGILPDWTPANITTALWLDAADASTITEVTGVSNWADKSTVGTRDVAQATGTKQPIYNSTTKTVTFDGIDDNLASTFGATLTQPNTIFTVGSYTTFGGFPFMVDGIATSNRHTIGVNTDQHAIYAGGSILRSAASSADANEKIIMGTYDGASSEQRINDTQTDTGNAGANSLTGVTIGSQYDGNAVTFFDGAIREIIIINGSLSSADREKASGYLAWKWDTINGDTALVTALPAGHPYKSAAPLA